MTYPTRSCGYALSLAPEAGSAVVPRASVSARTTHFIVADVSTL